MPALSAPIKAPIFSLEHYIQDITLEAGIVDNMVLTLRDVLPNFLKQLLPEIKEFDNIASTPAVKLSKDENEAIKKLRDIEFQYLRKITFDGPEGFTGSYLLFAKILNSNIEYILSISKTVKEYKTFLSGLLSNGDARLSTKDLSFKYKELAKEREAREDGLATFIKRGSYKVQLPIGEVFDRTSDIEAAITEFATIDKRMSLVDLKQLKNDVDACVDILNLLIQRINEGDIKNLTPAAAKSLSIGAYEMARNVQYVASAYYTILTGITGTNRLIEKILKF